MKPLSPRDTVGPAHQVGQVVPKAPSDLVTLCRCLPACQESFPIPQFATQRLSPFGRSGALSNSTCRGDFLFSTSNYYCCRFYPLFETAGDICIHVDASLVLVCRRAVSILFFFALLPCCDWTRLDVNAPTAEPKFALFERGMCLPGSEGHGKPYSSIGLFTS